MWPDATPVSLAEAEICKRYVTGRSQALFFDCFESGAGAWTLYGTKHMGSNHGLYVGHRQKAVAGDAAWTDYVFEGKALLKIHWLKGKQPAYAEEEGNPSAGLLFRVNESGEALEDVRCYSVFHDGRNLMLGRGRVGTDPADALRNCPRGGILQGSEQPSELFASSAAFGTPTEEQHARYFFH